MARGGYFLFLVVLVLIFRSASASRAEDGLYLEPFHTEHFVCHGRTGTIKVDLKQRFREGYLWITWGPVRRHGQRLSLRKYWWPRASGDFGGHLPPVFFWNVGEEYPLVVAICSATHIYGSWDFIVPAIYRLRNGGWRQISGGPTQETMSATGGFFVRRRRMYVFDIQYDDRYAHRDDQKYFLTEYDYIAGRLRKIRTRITRHRYECVGWDALQGEKIYRRHDDPLREFSLRWHWWAPCPQGEPRH